MSIAWKSNPNRWDRREAMGALAAMAWGGSAVGAPRQGEGLSIATFSADVTIPKGHACMGGGIAPASEVADPLFAKGIVLRGAGLPVVIVSVDWCEIRDGAFDRWREALAEAAGTESVRVLVSSVHVHDAPVADLEAERLLRERKSPGSVCDPEFHESAVRKVAESLVESLKHARPISHIGTGKAKVDQVASNRRFLNPDGSPTFGRTSATRDPYARAQPEGTIDPWLRCLSFWDEDEPLAALNTFAVHPMSLYGQGKVSADFVGDARRLRQADQPSLFQIYLSGCSGNVTAGKYNDGNPANRDVLAGRILDAMRRAWDDSKKHPLTTYRFRSDPLRFEPRGGQGFTVEDLKERLNHDPKPFGQCLAAMGLSWRKRCEAGKPIDLPVIDLGAALVALFPGESYVEFQLAAQAARPDTFVMALGYGECGTGYVPTERAVTESDTNLNDWCWVAPGAEKVLLEAMRRVL